MVVQREGQRERAVSRRGTAGERPRQGTSPGRCSTQAHGVCWLQRGREHATLRALDQCNGRGAISAAPLLALWLWRGVAWAMRTTGVGV